MSSQERDHSARDRQGRNQEDPPGNSKYRRQHQRDLDRSFFGGSSMHFLESHAQFCQYEGRDSNFVSPTLDHMQRQGQSSAFKSMSWSKEGCDQLLERVKTQGSKRNRSEASAGDIVGVDEAREAFPKRLR
ncbi:hypothetical protein BGZ79_006688 [Entomortierella chlamydospora]|nr:hypothetical protein BGZ79_006688 [Entomortierella chlamydospora]